MAKAAIKNPAGKKGEIIKVRGPEDGRWRGGLWFGPSEVEVDLSTLSTEQLAEIEGDPYLSIRKPAPPADPPAGGAAA
ncbi:hypothetical protein [Methylocystis heyeri]|uniref:Mu-like prophage FluMu N-terminal domain-containing protein n=1 Tax=Methylocystis heyeri TaxID=391905 RepID=A0A6B8KJI4_9HYPH|nr:hypothetical protein [Methylocystis heyeri]QGM46733.1 hypothetical protein H2LOC_014095 [Methylocystis heyeri]